MTCLDQPRVSKSIWKTTETDSLCGQGSNLINSIKFYRTVRNHGSCFVGNYIEILSSGKVVKNVHTYLKYGDSERAVSKRNMNNWVAGPRGTDAGFLKKRYGYFRCTTTPPAERLDEWIEYSILSLSGCSSLLEMHSWSILSWIGYQCLQGM